MSLLTDETPNQVNRPHRVGTSLPSTCKRGDIYFLVGTVNKIYASFAVNTWTEIFSSSGPTIPVNALAGNKLQYKDILTGHLTLTPLLTGVSYPNIKLINSSNSGDIDLYTVPTGRKLLFLSSSALTAGNGTNAGIAIYSQIKVGGVYYKVSVPVTVSANAAIGTSIALVQVTMLNAGESISINAAASGFSIVGNQIVEFDDTVPLYTARSFAPTTGDNVLYTVPTGKQGILCGSFYYNASGNTRTVIGYLVPSGDSTGITNKFATSTVTNNNNVSNPVPTLRQLAAGDQIVFNLDAGTSEQHLWGHYIETSV